MFSEFHLLSGVAWQLLYSTVELSENILHNLQNKLPPQSVVINELGNVTPDQSLEKVSIT